MKNQTLKLVVVFLVVLVGSALMVYALLRGTTNQAPRIQAVPAPSPEASALRSGAEEPNQAVRQPAAEDNSLLGRMFESRSAETDYASDGLGTTLARITLRLLLAAFLGAVLAYRPRKQPSVSRRNPYVAQTQILLAIVASALMMIVGDNAARAFGIFAAVSLVRFRTNIRDPKEISVLLISLALGLATGVGRPDLAVILCAFVLFVLWILETFEVRQAFRAMELKVATKDIEASQRALKTVLDKHKFTSELRAFSRDGEDRAGTIIVSVDLSPLVSTDKLSEEIFSQDSGKVTSIEWSQKKSFSYPYQ